MKNVLDSYFTKIVLQPMTEARPIIVLGYFNNSFEFREIIEKLGSKIKSRSRLEYFIHTFPNKVPFIKSETLDITSDGVISLESQQLSLKNEEGISQFVSRHFQFSSNNVPKHYWVEVNLEFDTRVEETTVLGYISAINELSDVVREIGERIFDSGALSIQIVEGDSGKKISFRNYQMKANGEVYIPDDTHHYFNLRKEIDVQNFCYFLWENDLLTSNLG